MNNFDWKNLIDPLFYIHFDVNGIKMGIYIVLFIVFAETGLFAGFFLPGDSLLFLAGIYNRELIENVLFIYPIMTHVENGNSKKLTKLSLYQKFQIKMKLKNLKNM